MWKFDPVEVGLIWVDESGGGGAVDGAEFDLGSGDLEIDMQEYSGDGSIDQGERIL
ncbi:MAG: hypothetical protein VKL41_05065 [Snowella sp.]|nr:hypothetical protein [Snowella sp.]